MERRILTTFLALITISFSTASQVTTAFLEVDSGPSGKLRGIVKSRDGEPLVGATVLVKELKRGTSTNADGQYDIENLPAGTYTVEVSYISYQSANRKVTIRDNETTHEDFVLESSVIHIGGVEVVAEADLLPKGAETKTEITSGEIAHFQASSVGDVLNLVPGVQKTENPGLGKTSQVAIRGDQSDALSAFGTLVVVDGVPISNNANLQFERWISGKTGTSNIGRGVDLRTVPADNLESIEVVRGLPSVRYGDATEGVINIRTKMGRQPHRLSIKNNPDTREGNIGGGFAWNNTGINYNLNIAQSERDIRKKGDEYTRLTAQLVINRKFFDEALSTNHKLLFQRIFDEEEPKGDVYQTKNYNRGFTLGYSVWGEYKPSNISLITYNAFLTYRRENSMKSKLVQSDLRILPTGDTVSTYLGKVETHGNEWIAGGRLEWQRTFLTGDIFHTLLAGVDIQYNANTGDGVLIDTLFNYYGAESGKVSYRFDDIPGQTLVSLYVEDRITGTLLKQFTITPGFRYEMYRPYGLHLSGLFGKGDLVQSHQGTFFNPRLNLTIYLSEDNQLRMSAGSTSKSPPMSLIYPPPEVLRWRNPFDSSTIYIRLDRRSPELKGYKEHQYEISFDQKIGNLVGTSLSLYYKQRKNDPVFQTHPVFVTAYDHGQPLVFFVNKYGIAENINNTISKGVEFSLKTKRIKPLNMEFQIVGSYNHSKYFSDGWSYDENPDQSIGRYPNYKVPNVPVDTLIGFYYPSEAWWRDVLLVNYYLRYIVPPLGLWVTLRAEQTVLEHYQESNLEPVIWEKLTETAKAQRLFDESIRSKPNKWLWSINISKSLSKGSEISFYVNNFFDDPAIYRKQLSPDPSDLADESRNPSLFYGIEFSILIDSLWE